MRQVLLLVVCESNLLFHNMLCCAVRFFIFYYFSDTAYPLTKLEKVLVTAANTLGCMAVIGLLAAAIVLLVIIRFDFLLISIHASNTHLF